MGLRFHNHIFWVLSMVFECRYKTHTHVNVWIWVHAIVTELFHDAIRNFPGKNLGSAVVKVQSKVFLALFLFQFWFLPIFSSFNLISYFVTPPNALSTIKAVTLSFTSPVTGSLTGVLAKTVNTSAKPPK